MYYIIKLYDNQSYMYSNAAFVFILANVKQTSDRTLYRL
jgi:hypothetical protein